MKGSNNMAIKFKVYNSWVIERYNVELYYDDQLVVFDNPNSAAEFLVDMCNEMGISNEGLAIKFYKEIEVEDYIDATNKAVWFSKDWEDFKLIDKESYI